MKRRAQLSRSEHINVIQSLLGLPKTSQAVKVAMQIDGIMHMCVFVEERRRMIPDMKIAQRRVEQIATTAAKLAQLLGKEPAAIHIVRTQISDITEIMSSTPERDNANLREFIIRLQAIRAKSEALLDYASYLRTIYFPPSALSARRSGVHTILWPFLFQAWEWSGQKVAKTPDGPLHRFVAYLHSALGLPEVRASTLRDAVTAYLHESKSTRARKKIMGPPLRGAGRS
jgi:hypothetical protein